MPTSWKSEVLVHGEWSSNALRFATKDEALRAGSELLSRWTVPDAHRAVESNESVNYEFPTTISRPRPIQNEVKHA